MRAKGRKPGTNPALAQRLHLHIVVHRHSPEVAAALMEKDGFEHAVCFKTIYNHIDKGLVPGVTNEALWEKRNRRKGRKTLHRKRKRAVEPGHGIEDRPAEVEERLEAGHWEIDLVVGGTGKGTAALLTLTERKTRKQIIHKPRTRPSRPSCGPSTSSSGRWGRRLSARSSRASRRTTAASSLTREPLNARCRADRAPTSTTPIRTRAGNAGATRTPTG